MVQIYCHHRTIKKQCKKEIFSFEICANGTVVRFSIKLNVN